MQEQLVIEAIQAAASLVFSTMLGKELTQAAAHEEVEAAVPSEGVFAQISLVGACSITALVNCSSEAACSIASALMMDDCPVVNADVLDAMAEIANMIMGNVKTDLDGQLGATNLSIPTVISGSQFSVHNKSKRWIVLPFAMEGGDFSVKVCFEQPPTPIHRASARVASRSAADLAISESLPR